MAAVAGWFAASSFLAFHAMFDRSVFTRWEWVREELDPPPARWVHVSAGLELTRIPLGELFPGSQGASVDIYDEETMPAPAVGRARERRADATSAPPDALPVEKGWADAVLVVLAAHEIRSRPMREKFFSEIDRILAPEGRLVLVEHLRDLSSALAFGPGFLHFLPRGEWLRLTRGIHLRVERERSFTPFVRVFLCRREPPAASTR
ncbi:methyltransferase domain-containing protein [bacterium]|nr:methyltransferase domain-containing protein [bacterium]